MTEIPMIDWGLVLSVGISIVGARVISRLAAHTWRWFSDLVWKIIA